MLSEAVDVDAPDEEVGAACQTAIEASALQRALQEWSMRPIDRLSDLKRGLDRCRRLEQGSAAAVVAAESLELPRLLRTGFYCQCLARIFGPETSAADLGAALTQLGHVAKVSVQPAAATLAQMLSIESWLEGQAQARIKQLCAEPGFSPQQVVDTLISEARDRAADQQAAATKREKADADSRPATGGGACRRVPAHTSSCRGIEHVGASPIQYIELPWHRACPRPAHTTS